MSIAPNIVDRLGGTKKVSAALGVPYTTVDTWRRKGRIPAWRLPSVEKLAEDLGKRLTAKDFPPRPARRAA